MDQKTFENLVKEKFNSLSSGQKKVAEYLIEQLEEAAFSTAVKIGRKVDVSETTVIRLSYALGFSGFSEMQENIQKQILNNSYPHAPSSPDRIADVEDGRSAYARAVEHDIKIMRQTMLQLDVQEIEKIADALIQADRVLVVGSRTSYAAAYWFSITLGTLRDNVEGNAPAGDVMEKLCDLTEKSVVFAISFPRYSKETLQVAKGAKELGATLISATDRILSPIGRISDYILTTEDANSFAPVMSLLYAVITGIHLKYKDKTRARQQRLEQIYSRNEVYIE
ncbi:MurR/RpiR family transcriptional regulator [Brevibacillus sp. B_LB10_24]|uniref:MurR/RpiR family transcriptional regulator n=1 Tax=Brevibacillus sp. B_LB10_24 TaxID=3380645 RepID=UPI0038BD6552